MAPFTSQLSPPSGPKFVADALQTLEAWSKSGCTTIFDAGIGLISPETDIDVRLLDAITSNSSDLMRFTGAFTAAAAQALRS